MDELHDHFTDKKITSSLDLYFTRLTGGGLSSVVMDSNWSTAHPSCFLLQLHFSAKVTAGTRLLLYIPGYRRRLECGVSVEDQAVLCSS